MKFLFAFFRDPNIMLLNSEIIEADDLTQAVKIFGEKYPDVEFLYVYNQKYPIIK